MKKVLLLMLILSIYDYSKPTELGISYNINKDAVKDYYQGYKTGVYVISDDSFIVLYSYQKNINMLVNTVDFKAEIFNFGNPVPINSFTVISRVYGKFNKDSCQNTTCIEPYRYFTIRASFIKIDTGYIVTLLRLPCTDGGEIIMLVFDTYFKEVKRMTIETGYICFMSAKLLDNGNILLVYNVGVVNPTLSINIYNPQIYKIFNSTLADNFETAYFVAINGDMFYITLRSGGKNYCNIYNQNGSFYKNINLHIDSVDFVHITPFNDNLCFITWIDNKILKGNVLDINSGIMTESIVTLAQVEDPFTITNKNLRQYRVIKKDNMILLLFRGYRDGTYKLIYKNIVYFKLPNGSYKFIFDTKENIISDNISLNSKYIFIQQPTELNNEFIFFWFPNTEEDKVDTEKHSNSYYLGLNRKIQTKTIVFPACKENCLFCNEKNFECSTCPSGFELIDNSCQCPKNSFLFDNQCNNCLISQQNCAEFDSKTCTCSMCYDNFILKNRRCVCNNNGIIMDNNKCDYSCLIPNCLQLEQEQCECEICKDGFAKYKGRCINLDEETCETYNPKLGRCDKCINGLVFNADRNICECPHIGEFYDNIQCVKCADNCEVCQDLASCKVCIAPMLPDDNNICVCPPLYYLNNGECKSYLVIIIAIAGSITFAIIVLLVSYYLYVKYKKRVVKQTEDNKIEIAVTGEKKGEEAEKPEEENKSVDISKDRICEICLQNPKTVLLDCGSEIPHLTCYECFVKLNEGNIITCPFDRNIIDNLI
jgi:hypothetical protein